MSLGERRKFYLPNGKWISRPRTRAEVILINAELTDSEAYRALVTENDLLARKEIGK